MEEESGFKFYKTDSELTIIELEQLNKTMEFRILPLIENIEKGIGYILGALIVLIVLIYIKL